MRNDSEQLCDSQYWLDFAARVLAGEIAPDDAQRILKLGSLYFENEPNADP
jgi:hypothetical protein